MTAITAPAASAAEVLEPCERAILSVLRLWPRGAAEAAVAHRAGLDTTTAAVALRRLLDAGLVVSSEETPPARRHHQRIVFWRLAGASATAALMADVPRPDPAQRRGPQGPVPGEFWHHFCSGSDPADLRLPRDATWWAAASSNRSTPRPDPGCCHTSPSSSSPPATAAIPTPAQKPLS